VIKPILFKGKQIISFVLTE